MPNISKPKGKPKAPQNPSPPEAPKLVAAGTNLESLAERLGPPDAAFASRTFRTAAEADLVEAGTAVDSIHVVDDVPRFAGSVLSIWEGLSEEQRQRVRFPHALLPLLVHETLKLREMKTTHESQRTDDAAEKVARERKARQATRDGIAERDTVYDSLRSALGDERLDEMNVRVGTAETADKLAKGLEALADFIDRVVKADPEDAAALGDYGAGPERAVALRARAKVVREHGQATSTSARRVTQRALDLQDGRVLLIMGKVLRAFRAAARADATILLPELNRLSRLFESRPAGKRPPAAPPDGSEDAPPPAAPPA